MKRHRFLGFTLLLAFLYILPAQVAGQSATGVSIELVSLTPSGAYPSSITRQQGEFILFIRNRLPLHENIYTLTSTASGSNAATVSASLSADEFHDYVYQNLTLSPGEYVLTFKNNPQYSVKLTVTAP